MIPNHSPWIKQLKRTRQVIPLDKDLKTDVVIVGGGIAGVVTAYFTLLNTDKSVVLIEADMIAHGATGHNAGQITSYFERPLFEIAEEFGLDLAVDGQRSVESAWNLLEQIVKETNLKTPFYQFIGYAGLSSIDHLLVHLKNNALRVKGGIKNETITVAKEWEGIKDIPKEYDGLYELVSQKEILSSLETDNTDFIASVAYQKGCMNSALFSEELIGYFVKKYKDRFSFYEGSPMKSVSLRENHAVLEILDHKIETDRVVLCTNGFENFKINNEFGSEIDTKFHHFVIGRIGYMSGYLEPSNHLPTAISYFTKKDERNIDPTGESYFYLTRRPHEHESGNIHNLICIGGPEKILPNGATYSREESCLEDVCNTADDFLRNYYNKYPNEEVDYSFCWHGLMGYTPNGIRKIGPEPLNPVLLYNLGCNGVGILPSIFGGMRISRFLRGDMVEKSIFDPDDRRDK